MWLKNSAMLRKREVKFPQKCPKQKKNTKTFAHLKGYEEDRFSGRHFHKMYKLQHNEGRFMFTKINIVKVTFTFCNTRMRFILSY